MPTVVEIIDTITEWAKTEICSKIRLKMPPKDDKDSNTEGYEYIQIEPVCYPFFIPSKDKLPPSVLSPFPALCVGIIEGTDDLTANSGSLVIEFAFSTWSTGTHGKDILIPDKEKNLHFKEWNEEEAEQYFKPNLDGWRDCWNWVDIGLRAVGSSAAIKGIQIDRNTPVTYGAYTNQGEIADNNPFWFAWLRFAVKRPLIRNIKEYNDLL